MNKIASDVLVENTNWCSRAFVAWEIGASLLLSGATYHLSGAESAIDSQDCLVD